jgi:hypothetical protein
LIAPTQQRICGLMLVADDDREILGLLEVTGPSRGSRR